MIPGATERPASPPGGVDAVALVPWGLLAEDFLDTIGVSLEAFSTEMTGSWLFSYAEALRRTGLRAVILLVSGRVDVVTRYEHRPSGATVCIFPAPGLYTRLRRGMVNPYSKSVKRTFAVDGFRRLLYPWFIVVKEISPYLATPLRLLARELRMQRCAAVICHEYEFPRFDVCVGIGRLMKIPVLGTFQGGTRQAGLTEHFVRPLAMRCSAGFAIAPRAEMQRVHNRYGVAKDKIFRVFNPIDLSSFKPVPQARARARLGIPPDSRVVVWHGRVEVRTKGLDILLAAWQKICQERPDSDMRLLLVGSGSDAAILQDQLSGGNYRGVSWLQEFTHDRQLLGQYLSAADVYAFPSRREGFPVAPLEALAHGLPVVAADAEGIRDIFELGEAHGGIVVPRDQAGALAVALGRLLDNPTFKLKMGQRARERVRTFSMDEVSRDLWTMLVRAAPALRREPGIES